MLGPFNLARRRPEQTLNLNIDFGTNVFSSLQGNASAASGFVFGQSGTAIVYIVAGTIYDTNSTGEVPGLLSEGITVRLHR